MSHSMSIAQSSAEVAAAEVGAAKWWASDEALAAAGLRVDPAAILHLRQIVVSGRRTLLRVIWQPPFRRIFFGGASV